MDEAISKKDLEKYILDYKEYLKARQRNAEGEQAIRIKAKLVVLNDIYKQFF